MYLRRPRNQEQFESHGSMAGWQGVKLFYMQFAQMEMSMEAVPQCQGGSGRHSICISPLSHQPWYSFMQLYAGDKRRGDVRSFFFQALH